MPAQSVSKPRWYLSPGMLAALLGLGVAGVLGRLAEYGEPVSGALVPASFGFLCGAAVGLLAWWDRENQAGLWSRQLVGIRATASSGRAVWVQKAVVLGAVAAIGVAARLLASWATRLAFDVGFVIPLVGVLCALHRLAWRGAWDLYRGTRG